MSEGNDLGWLKSFSDGRLQEKDIFDLSLEERLRLKPIITTFYSHRGGVGRSTALANTAIILAEKGYKVVCIDADLEAPSLDEIFQLPPADDGFLKLLIKAELDQLSKEDILSSINQFEDLDLYVLSSGKLNLEYVKDLRWIDTDLWYEEGKSPFDKIVDLLGKTAISPDFILIDAKTGISDLNSPFLFKESDLVISLFIPNTQSFAGNRLLINGVEKSLNNRGLRPALRFVASMLPPTQTYAQKLIQSTRDFLSEFSAENVHPDDNLSYISYSESVSSNSGIREYSRSAYKHIATWIELIIPQGSNIIDVSRVDPAEKTKIAEDILGYLSVHSLSSDNKINSESFFIKSSQYDKILDKTTTFVVGRKGTGKTSLFIHFVETHRALVMAAPVGLLGRYPKAPTRKVYADWKKEHGNTIDSWRKFWLLQILNCNSPMDIFEQFGHMSEEIIAQTFIDTAKKSTTESIYAIDGLDDGFGSSKSDLETRAAAIEGLLDFWYHYGSRMNNYIFKIFIRKDLWDRASVVNKSHFYGRTVNIKWSQEDYFSILTKISLNSPKFKSFYNSFRNIEQSGLSEQDEVLNALFNPRMEGEKSAFTKNWIWNRLSDSNGEHSVRMLISLFRESLERTIQLKSEKFGIISPKALMLSMNNVSDEALTAIQEEYQAELSKLIDAVKKIDATPFDRAKLRGISQEVVDFAGEVGFLSVRKDGKISIPDLYRYALEISRRGQQ